MDVRSKVSRLAALAVLSVCLTGAPNARAAGKKPGFDKTTLRIGGMVLDVGLEMKVTWVQAIAALAAAMTETNGPNQPFPAKISNLSYGHSSSVGIFQMLDIHGSKKQRMNPRWASRWFFQQARRQQDARDADSIARLSQAVEDSAFPGRYKSQVKDAKALARALGYCKRDGKLALKPKPEPQTPASQTLAMGF